MAVGSRLKAVPLRPEHLTGFAPDEPVALATIPPQQFGNGFAVIDGKRTLAVVGAWKNDDGSAGLGLLLAPEARRFPVTLHRMARQTVRGLHMQGHYLIRAKARDDRSARWLRRLGFVETEEGYIHDDRI